MEDDGYGSLSDAVKDSERGTPMFWRCYGPEGTQIEPIRSSNEEWVASLADRDESMIYFKAELAPVD